MNPFRFLDPLFPALNDGKIIRVTIAWAIRILAVGLAVTGVLWCITSVVLGIKSSDMFGTPSGELLLGCVCFGLFGLVFAYVGCGICLFRAKSILELGDSHFSVLSVLSILFRLNGEIAFVAYSLVGVGGCILLWVVGFNPMAALGHLTPQLPFMTLGSGGLFGGLEFALFMLLIAFLAIVISYALAELSMVTVEIANNTHYLPALAGYLRPGMLLSSPVEVAPAPVEATPLSSNGHARPKDPLLCKACGEPVESGSVFCAECGQSVLQ